VKQSKDVAPVADEAPEASNLEKILARVAESMEANQPRKSGNSRRVWPEREIPEKVGPGYAIVSDEHSQSPKLVPVYFVMQHSSKVRPMERQFSGAPVMTGALVDKVNSRQMIVQQFAKLPDGHLVKGHGKYFDYSTYKLIDGVYYHPRHLPTEG
jgi:hypothetical protein